MLRHQCSFWGGDCSLGTCLNELFSEGALRPEEAGAWGWGRGMDRRGHEAAWGQARVPSMQTWPRRCALHLKSFRNNGDFL